MLARLIVAKGERCRTVKQCRIGDAVRAGDAAASLANFFFGSN